MKISQPCALHEIGKRANNEDCIYPPKGELAEDQRFFIVCDGIGGHEHGEVASRTVCESFATALKDLKPDDFNERVFETVLDGAYDALDQIDGSNVSGKKMGTTLSFLYLNNRQALMAHIGDSRIYHFRKKETGETAILYKSSDHSFVNELVKSGIITEEEAANHPKRNVITRAMQPNPEKRCRADIHITRNVAAGDRFFLCTDGVLESLSDEQLCNMMAENTDNETIIKEIHEQCREMSRDNFSAWLVTVSEGKADHATPCVAIKKSEMLYPFMKAFVVISFAIAAYFLLSWLIFRYLYY